MNEKINLQDLSALLAEKAAITKKEAETFLRVYFEIMNEELISSGLLKIKDLGAFKLSLMEDRESIDVTTGERVLIAAHYKVVFTPDKKLAEQVNEPFALFETIEIEEEGFETEKLKLLSEEDTSKESEFTLEEEEEISFEKEPIMERETGLEEETVPEEDRRSEEKPVSSHDPDSEKESLLEKKTDKNGEQDSQKRSTPHWNAKNHCLNCHDYEAHRIYRKKYFNARKKLKRQRVIVGVLSILLVGALSYILYLYQFEKFIAFKDFVPEMDVKKYVSEENAVPEFFGTLNDSIVPTEGPKQKEINEKILLPETSGKSKQITVVAGQRLTSIAEEEYGNKVFWIYIYLENKAIISNPEVLGVGTKISIPPADKYGIDCNNQASIQRAKELADKNL